MTFVLGFDTFQGAVYIELHSPRGAFVRTHNVMPPIRQSSDIRTLRGGIPFISGARQDAKVQERTCDIQKVRRRIATLSSLGDNVSTRRIIRGRSNIFGPNLDRDFGGGL